MNIGERLKEYLKYSGMNANIQIEAMIEAINKIK